ncbi:MAG: hypothetical protein A2133_08695 [Actinobacteria bacterium RBG_16_64_13]|nr:MAG: hypothetical protein A2133_08695 [Actinobacteria bacterium RBG_16_64_13]
MMRPHQYEKVIEEALKYLPGGPWKDTDLVRVREVITDDMCGHYGPDCKSSEVLEWLDSLDADQREELLFEANADLSASQDPWALG